MEQNNNAEEIEIDIKELLIVLLSKIWIIIVVTIAGGAVALLYTTLFMSPVYQSTASMYIITKTTTLTSLTDLQIGSQLTNDYMVIAKSRRVVEQVIDDLDLDETQSQFLSNVTLKNTSNTRVLSITVTDNDPYMAKTIVDAYAQAIATETANIMDTDEPRTIDMGDVSLTPISPNVTKNTLIGAACGFVLAAVIIICLYLLNDAIKTSEDAEKYLGLTSLGTIPVSGGQTKGRKNKQRGGWILI